MAKNSGNTRNVTTSALLLLCTRMGVLIDLEYKRCSRLSSTSGKLTQRGP